MSARGITRLAACKTIPRSSIGRYNNYTYGFSPAGNAVRNPSLSPKCWVRGAKTKTVIKAQDLPQGVLPPLPKDETNEALVKPYPETFQQHLNNMRKFPDCVLLTRVGDFYEMYFEHVPKYAPLLGLKQAKKKSGQGHIPMAGFQHVQLDKYLKILVIDYGFQVAIAEQVSITVGDKLKFDRPVARVVTKGTLIAESFLPASESSYLLAIHLDAPTAGQSDAAGGDTHERYNRASKVGLSWVDLSSGDFYVQTSDIMSLPSNVARIGPSEIVLDSSLQTLSQNEIQHLLGEVGISPRFHAMRNLPASVAEWSAMLERPVPEAEAATFTRQDLAAGNIVLDYVQERLQSTPLQLQPPVKRTNDESMMIDKQTLRGLEIKCLLRDGTSKGSLLHAIRQTVTTSGARLLSKRIVAPSMSLSVINNRLDLVQQMLEHDALREDVQALLLRTSDTARLVQKFSVNKGDADDLLGLAATIDVTSDLAVLLHDHILGKQSDVQSPDSALACLWDILNRLDLDEPRKLAKSIENAIDREGLSRQQAIEAGDREEAEEMAEEVIEADAAGEAVPRLARRVSQSKQASSDVAEPEEVWIMKESASPTLKRAHQDLRSLLEARDELVIDLQQRLSAPTLTLQWSSNLMHYCQLKGKDAKADLPSRHGLQSVRSTKSTRSFYHPKWTELGGKIDSSKLRIRNEEDRVLGNLRRQVLQNMMKLRRNAGVLDELDVACSSAEVAKERNLIRPRLNQGTSHKIVGGRHPTVDVGLQENGRRFTTNDCAVGDEERIYLITGPNMAGKSTYLRQNALITILAQTGCFVPADYAEIGLVDKIFSRVGSADNLYQDQSTFMVEMQETAEILQHATARSFVIMDEVGRGTTPEDGVAVGYACLHHLHHIIKCRTLFATHFHVLADMTAEFENLNCFCTDVAEEKDGSWIYVHKLRRGVNRKSHALKVARLAGLPEEAIAVAAEVLAGGWRSEDSEQFSPSRIAIRASG